MGIFPVCYGRDHVSGILFFSQNVCIGDVFHLFHGELLGVEQLVGGVGEDATWELLLDESTYFADPDTFTWPAPISSAIEAETSNCSHLSDWLLEILSFQFV